MYAPFEFTHQQGVLQTGPLYYNRKMAYPSDIEPYRDYGRVVCGCKNPYPDDERFDKAWFRKRMQPAFDFAARHPEKISWCGEFGSIRHCRLEDDDTRDILSPRLLRIMQDREECA